MSINFRSTDEDVQSSSSQRRLGAGMQFVPAMTGMILCAVLGVVALAIVPPAIGLVAANRNGDRAGVIGHALLVASIVLVLGIQWTVFRVPIV